MSYLDTHPLEQLYTSKSHETAAHSSTVKLQPGEVLREVGEAHQSLAATLNVMTRYQNEATATELQALQGAVVDDAHSLAVTVLPRQAVKELAIPVARHDDVGFEHPPMLSDLFLLVRAYDTTGDAALKDTIEFILETVPPNQADLIADAYRRSLEHQTPIMEEYFTLARQFDSELDRNQQ